MNVEMLRLLSSNVRGLNCQARRDAANELVRESKASIVCMQETKLQAVDRQTVIEAIGFDFADDFAFLPADGTRGGIILAVAARFYSLSSVSLTPNSVSAVITSKEDGSSWTATGVYGPQGEAQKTAFIDELRQIVATRPQQWLLFRDFNLIYMAADKNNTNLNRRLMGKFKAALDAMRIRELKLTGRKFTWSSGQASPTMTRIDRFFCSEDWDTGFPSAILQSLPSSLSDHAPLLLIRAADIPRFATFRFEAFWLKMEGFQEVVAAAWEGDVVTLDPMRRFHVKLERTAAALKKWHRKNFGNLKFQGRSLGGLMWPRSRGRCHQRRGDYALACEPKFWA